MELLKDPKIRNSVLELIRAMETPERAETYKDIHDQFVELLNEEGGVDND